MHGHESDIDFLLLVSQKNSEYDISHHIIFC